MGDYSLLIPQIPGAEKYNLHEVVGVTVYSGSGFDEDNPIHRFGSDALRYAIAIQQYRDQKDWTNSDAARRQAEYYYFVMQGDGWTRLLTKPPGFDRLPNTMQNIVKGRVRMSVVDGIIYDR